jgi:uncharacterized protein YegL
VLLLEKHGKEENRRKKMSIIKTHCALILDKSGSMQGIRDSALNSFNEQIQTLKAESNSPDAIAKKMLVSGGNPTGVETYVTLVLFNDNVDYLNFDQNVNDIEEFPSEKYQPNGSTALFDAIGMTIDRFTSEIQGLDDPDTGMLFIIVTDGQENASKTWGQEQGRMKLKSRIEELQETKKWTFTFIGSEKVMETAVDHLGLHAGNTASFSAKSSAGWAAAGVQMASSTRGYMSARMLHKTSVDSYYSGDDNATGPTVIDPLVDSTVDPLTGIDKSKIKLMEDAIKKNVKKQPLVSEEEDKEEA